MNIHNLLHNLSTFTSVSYHCVKPFPPVLIYSRHPDSHKMYNLLTLVDQLHFICKRKKSISVTKKKKNFTMVERELFIRENHSLAEKRDEVELHDH